MEGNLKQYFNECLAKMPSTNNESFDERYERDLITVAILNLRMKLCY